MNASTSARTAGLDGIQHMILTRFNVMSGGRESRLRDQPGWLERRFKLFERFCLPSVAHQTRPDFV